MGIPNGYVFSCVKEVFILIYHLLVTPKAILQVRLIVYQDV